MIVGRASRLLGLVAVVLFLLSAYTPLPNLFSSLLQTPSDLEPAEGIVVLASGLQENGVLGDESLRRALYGIVLYRKRLAPLLVFSGGVSLENPSEAEIRATLARDLGVSPDAILTEVNAMTTREEAIRMKALLQPRGIRKILLVTESLHMGRARGVFQRAGFEVLAAVADNISNSDASPEGRLSLMRRASREALARIYYRMAGYM